MNTFYEVLGFVAAMCLGVMVLTLFFTGLGFLKSKTRRFAVIKAKDFVRDGRLVNVHLSSGIVYRRVRFIGFTDQDAAKNGIPFQLAQMVVCETEEGARVLFRPDALRIIEEVGENAPSGASLRGASGEAPRHERQSSA